MNVCCASTTVCCYMLSAHIQCVQPMKLGLPWTNATQSSVHSDARIILTFALMLQRRLPSKSSRKSVQLQLSRRLRTSPGCRSDAMSLRSSLRCASAVCSSLLLQHHTHAHAQFSSHAASHVQTHQLHPLTRSSLQLSCCFRVSSTTC